MEEQKISIETAILAKEKGFDVEVFDSYHKNVRNNRIELLEFNSLCHGDSDNLINRITGDSDYCFPPKISFNTSWYKDYDYYSAPTQTLLQKWLREEHDIDVLIYRQDAEYYIYHVWGKSGRTDEVFKIYEEALEKGLQEALKLIKNS